MNSFKTLINNIIVEVSNKIDHKIDELSIDSSYGKTAVLVCGDVEKPPILLVHGLNSAAIFALDHLSFLLENYQIFAVDILGQPNKSEFVRLSKKNNSYGNWLLEVIEKLKLHKPTLCGISFGAFPILKSLLINDSCSKEVFLISPAAIVHGDVLKTIVRFLIPVKQFQRTQKEKYCRKFLENLYDDFDELTFNYQKEVFLNFDMDFSVTPNFTLKELLKLETQITIIVGENDFFVPYQKLKKRSKKITSLKNFIALENSKHISSKKKLKQVFIE